MRNGTKARGERQPLKITFVGHVDHGKSTLVGRLLHEVGALPEGKIDALRAVSVKRGMPFEWSFVMDALQAERDQGITIDTARIWFSTTVRDYVIIDAPGHKEFLKNMVTGAAGSDAAILVIDAAEGVREQTRRHGYLLHLLGVRQVVAVINKMDLVGYSPERFNEVKRELVDYLAKIGVTPAHVIPVSGREGENMAVPSDAMPWHDGPSLITALDEFREPTTAEGLPLRLPVQDVYKFDDRRIIAGRIESGTLRVGDNLRFSPSGKTARVKSIETWENRGPALAVPGPGRSVAITLDEHIFVERGHVASCDRELPHEVNQFRARIFWLGKEPLTVGKRYTLKLNTTEQVCEIVAIEKIIDAQDLSSREGTAVEANAIGEVLLRTKAPVALDDYIANPVTGRFVLIDNYSIAGGGIVVLDQRHDVQVRATNIHAVGHKVTVDSRIALNGHASGVLWLTGLSGAGKSTLALELEKQLHLKGYQVYVLDGDNVRSGLNKDLGFTEHDRFENIRRVGELANLFADAGMIVITAFISPYKADREAARFINEGRFHEVHVKADVRTCEARDPKGLYKKARAGEISDFTGVSAPYEEPDRAEVIIDTSAHSVDACVAELMAYVETNFSGKKNALSSVA